MREILFRGKRNNGEWVEGCYVYDNNQNYHIRAFDNCYYAVIPETIGQYTGLTDKNGKKIFEGDILRATPNCDVYIGHVYYEDAQWFGARDYLAYAVAYSGAEIIGNIHDSPELLEVKE